MSLDRVKEKRTLGTSFIPETLATALRIIIKNEIALSVNAATKGTMITMARTMTPPPHVILQLEDVMKGESRLSLTI
jgi:hypothetical protein